MSIYKRDRSPYWQMEYTDPRTGKVVRKSTGETDRKRAEAMLAEAIRRGRDVALHGYAGEITLKDALDAFVQSKAAEGGRWDVALGARKLLGLVEGHPGIDGSTMLHMLSSGDLMRLRNARLKAGQAASTINGEFKVLSAAINHVQRLDYRVPSRLEYPYLDIVRKIRFLSPDEEAAVLRELDPQGLTGVSGLVLRQRQDAYDLAVFLLDTGARYGEVSTIPWEVIDTTSWQWLTLYRWKVSNSGTLAITSRLRSILQRRWAERRNSAYVFPATGGTEDGPRAKSTKAIRRAIERAGCNTPEKVTRLGKATVHSFRHTAATRWRRAGMGLDEIQVLLGHSDIETTQIYTHLDDSAVASKAAAILDRLAS